MAHSVHEYVGDGTDQQLPINFTLGYLSKTHVHAYVEGEGTERTITWVNDGLITIGTVTSGLKILIRRIIPKTALQHDYANGAIFKEKNLDESNLQNVMLSHEVSDGFLETDAHLFADLDADDYTIKNLSNPVDAQDAVTLDHLESNYSDDTELQATLDAAASTLIGYAEEWANNDEDVLVSSAAGGDGVDDYSALHHAAKAYGHSLDAFNSKSGAQTAETNAQNSATAAAASASSAATSASSASSDALTALNALDSFDDAYLGYKASDPSLDNDGDPLQTGALYFNTTAGGMKVYTGSFWDFITSTGDATSLGGIAAAQHLLRDGTRSITGNTFLENNIALYGKVVGGAGVTLAKVNTSDQIELGGTTQHLILNSIDDPTVKVNFVNRTLWHSGNDGPASGMYADVTDKVADQEAGTAHKFSTLNIGDWDMDTNATKNVSHSFTVGTIRSIRGVIFSDSGATCSPITPGFISTADCCLSAIGSTTINLIRLTGGAFDNASYSTTPYNRGYLVIEHT